MCYIRDCAFVYTEVKQLCHSNRKGSNKTSCQLRNKKYRFVRWNISWHKQHGHDKGRQSMKGRGMKYECLWKDLDASHCINWKI